MMSPSRCLSLFILVISTLPLHATRIPRVTVILVIDQFAYHYLQKVKPHLRHGLHHLVHHGIVYENAYYRLGTPCTGPGHVTLNTGADPSYHGIPANNWYDAVGNKIYADTDNRPESAEFAPDGSTYDHGRSGHFIMTDGISDQFIFSATPCQPRFAYSLSYKSRSSVMTAGHMGKAIWFDNKTGDFTTSKAYFEQLPEWLKTFNQEAWHKTLDSYHWRLKYKKDSCAYGFADIDEYAHSSRTGSLAGKVIGLSSKPKTHPYDLFLRTPAANELLLDLAETCIKEHVHYCNNEQMVLWLSLSPLDMVGHEYGPHSREVLDMIYHLDEQIECFMKNITKILKRRDFLFVVTADHGVSFMPELRHEQGYKGAYRVLREEFIATLNKKIASEFGFENLIIGHQANQFYLRKDLLKTLDHKQEKLLLTTVRKHLEDTHIFKHVWTDDELMRSTFEPNSYESFYKYQYFKGRSGSIIAQPLPHVFLTEYPTGATHRSPYEHDTHVPLILYQKSYHEKRVVFDKVWMNQLANTLAHILHIPQPSTSPFPLLPGIIEYDPITGEAVQPVVL